MAPPQQSNVRTAKPAEPPPRTRIKLKLYFPFDPAQMYDGGQYLFFDADTFRREMITLFGNPEGMDDAAYDHDCRILAALDDIPTLDPFLVRDRLNGENLTVDPRYLMITAEEWKQVQHYIRNKIRPMVAMALPDGLTHADEHVGPMIDAFWNARDLTVLEPLMVAFRLPQDRTKDIIHAWKGVAYFEYHYAHVQKQVVEFARWMGGNITAHMTISRTDLMDINQIRDHIRQKIKDHLTICTRVLGEYNDSYEKLFQRKESPAPFINFLAQSPQHFWTIGESIMRMMHASETWRRSCPNPENMRKDVSQLRTLLSALDDLLG